VAWGNIVLWKTIIGNYESLSQMVLIILVEIAPFSPSSSIFDFYVLVTRQSSWSFGPIVFMVYLPHSLYGVVAR